MASKRKTLKQQASKRKASKGVAKKNRSTKSQIRSNLAAVVTFINNHTFLEAHQTALKKTHFWDLFDAFIHKKAKASWTKIDADLVQIIEAYVPERKSFFIANKNLRIMPSDFTLIYGIKCGENKLKINYNKNTKTTFVKRMFKNAKKLTLTMVKHQIEEAMKGVQKTDIEDVARLMCLLLIGSLFYPTTRPTIKWGFVSYIEDLDKVCSYNWSSSICKTLEKAVEEKYENPRSTTGCAITLLYWLCEHTTIIEPEDTANTSPRFLKWDLQKLSNALKKTPLNRIPSKVVFGSKPDGVSIINDMDEEKEDDEDEEDNEYEEDSNFEKTDEIVHLNHNCDDDDEEEEEEQHDNNVESVEKLKKKVRDLEEELNSKANENENLKLQVQSLQEANLQLETEVATMNVTQDAEIKKLKQQFEETERNYNEYMTEVEVQVTQPESAAKTRSLVKNIKTKKRRWNINEDFDYEFGKRITREASKKRGTIEEKEDTIIVVGEIEETLPKKTRKKLTKNNHIFKRLSEDDQKKVKDMNDDIGQDLSTAIWTSSNDNQVRLYDILSLIRQEGLTDNIFDCYSDILYVKQFEEGRIGNNEKGDSYFFTSTAMTYLRDDRLYLRENLLDKHIKEAHDKYKFLHFPLISCGNKVTANHWTLLVRDKDEGWSHYNSLKPREGIEDPYMKDAIEMMKHVERLIGVACENSKDKICVESVENCPQQDSATVDCGAYVCYFMEQISSHKEIEQLSIGEIRQFRANMIHEFLNCSPHTTK